MSNRGIEKGKILTAASLRAIAERAGRADAFLAGVNAGTYQSNAGRVQSSNESFMQVGQVYARVALAAWVGGGTAYKLGTLVTYAVGFLAGQIFTFRCLQDHESAAVAPPADPTNWQPVWTPYVVDLLDTASSPFNFSPGSDRIVSRYSPIFIDDNGFLLPAGTRGWLCTSLSGDWFMLLGAPPSSTAPTPVYPRYPYNTSQGAAKLREISAAVPVYRPMFLSTIEVRAAGNVIEDWCPIRIQAPCFGYVTGLQVSTNDFGAPGVDDHNAGLVNFVSVNVTTGDPVPQPNAPEALSVDVVNQLCGQGLGALACNFDDTISVWLRVTAAGARIRVSAHFTLTFTEDFYVVTGDGKLAGGASPNGVYVRHGDHNKFPAFERADGLFWIWHAPFPLVTTWAISSEKGVLGAGSWVLGGLLSPPGVYPWNGTATGTATVAAG